MRTVLDWLRPAPGRLQRIALAMVWLLLAVWAAGILLAAVQLGTWRQELTRTLTQLNADAYFRARVQNRESVDPEWYRRKATALISATERLQRDTLWTLFLPGSWAAFDRLEEQVQARLAREFGDIVVETVRRELYARASTLTGVALVRRTGDLQAGAECQSPVPRDVERKLAATAEDLPEFVAVTDYVAAVERLDAAVQSFLSLHYSGGHPEQLRQLLAYTLGKDVPGALAGSVRMFQGAEEVDVQRSLMLARLQWATRCSLGKAMGALHTRLLNTNDLFALEQGLVERSTGLFEVSARPAAFDRTLERYRAVHALLEDQHALLARGRNDWMRQAKLQLGPAYQDVMRRIERTRLFGPEMVHQLHHQSGAAFAEFRRQFEEAFGSRGQAGIVWVDGEQRFALSGERGALRAGLAGLLQASFMAEEPAPAGRSVRENPNLARVTQEARALAAERARVRAEVLPLFPAQAQPVVARVVDARVAELIYQRAYRTLQSAWPAERKVPFDALLFRQQREQVAHLQAVLKETGAGALGERLEATLDAELARRLAALHDEWQQHPLQDARATDFAAWQGEPLSPAQALGAAPARLEALVQQAQPLLALGSPRLLADASAARWPALQSELQRYQARAGDSSLLRLERYLAALGPDLRRDNCAERLAAAPAPAGDDEIAQRHLQVHQGLSLRCHQLRTQASAPADSAAQ